MMSAAGKTLIVMGAILLLLGVLLLVGDKVPFLGKLPGDVRIEGKRTSFYFPVVTCILLSILLTVLLNVLARLFLRK